MLKMIRTSFRRLQDQEGATAVEYGIMVAAIAAVIVAVVFVIGNQVQDGFCETSTAMGAEEGIEAAHSDC